VDDVELMQEDLMEKLKGGNEMDAGWLQRETVIQQAISRMPSMRKKVMMCRFYRGLAKRRTAKELCVSPDTVSKLERKALMTIQRALKRKALI